MTTVGQFLANTPLVLVTVVQVDHREKAIRSRVPARRITSEQGPLLLQDLGG